MWPVELLKQRNYRLVRYFFYEDIFVGLVAPANVFPSRVFGEILSSACCQELRNFLETAAPLAWDGPKKEIMLGWWEYISTPFHGS